MNVVTRTVSAHVGSAGGSEGPGGPGAGVLGPAAGDAGQAGDARVPRAGALQEAPYAPGTPAGSTLVADGLRQVQSRSVESKNILVKVSGRDWPHRTFCLCIFGAATVPSCSAWRSQCEQRAHAHWSIRQ